MEHMRAAGRGVSFAVSDAASDVVLGGIDLRLPMPFVGEVGYLLASGRPATRGP
jgi:hypothetical protein